MDDENDFTANRKAFSTPMTNLKSYASALSADPKNKVFSPAYMREGRISQPLTSLSRPPRKPSRRPPMKPTRFDINNDNAKSNGVMPPPLPAGTDTTFDKDDDQIKGDDENNEENDKDPNKADQDSDPDQVSEGRRINQLRDQALKSHAMVLALPLSEFEVTVGEKINELVESTELEPEKAPLISNVPGYYIVLAGPDQPIFNTAAAEQSADWLDKEDLENILPNVSPNNLDDDNFSELDDYDQPNDVSRWTYLYYFLPEYTKWGDQSDQSEAGVMLELNIEDPTEYLLWNLIVPSQRTTKFQSNTLKEGEFILHNHFGIMKICQRGLNIHSIYAEPAIPSIKRINDYSSEHAFELTLDELGQYQNICMYEYGRHRLDTLLHIATYLSDSVNQPASLEDMMSNIQECLQQFDNRVPFQIPMHQTLPDNWNQCGVAKRAYEMIFHKALPNQHVCRYGKYKKLLINVLITSSTSNEALTEKLLSYHEQGLLRISEWATHNSLPSIGSPSFNANTNARRHTRSNHPLLASPQNNHGGQQGGGITPPGNGNIMIMFDSKQFKKISIEFPIGNSTFKDELLLALENLKMVGVYNNPDGTETWPKKGVPVTEFSKRIAYNDYSTEEIMLRERQGLKDIRTRAVGSEAIKESKLLDDWPKLRYDDHMSIHAFCAKRNQKIANIVNFRVDGKFLMVPELKKAIARDLQLEVADTLDKPITCITNIDLEAYLFRSRMTQEAQIIGSHIPEMIKGVKLKVHDQHTIKDLGRKVCSQVKYVIESYELVGIINSDKTVFTNTVKAILSHFPKTLEKIEWDQYEKTTRKLPKDYFATSVINPEYKIYKDIQKYLSFLGERVLGYGPEKLDGVRKVKSIGAQTMFLNNINTELQDASDSEDNEEEGTVVEEEQEEVAPEPEVEEEIDDKEYENAYNIALNFIKSYANSSKPIKKAVALAVKKGKCFICNDPDHMMNQCPKKSRYTEEQLKQMAREGLRKLRLSSNKVFYKKNNGKYPTRSQQTKMSKFAARKVVGVNYQEIDIDSDSSSDSESDSDDDEEADEQESASINNININNVNTTEGRHGKKSFNRRFVDNRKQKGAKVGKRKITKTKLKKLMKDLKGQVESTKPNSKVSEEELAEWKKQCKIKILNKRKYLVAFPRGSRAAYDNTVTQEAVRMNMDFSLQDESVSMEYINDTGCVGADLAGKNFLEELKEAGIPEKDIWILSKPIPVSGPWNYSEQPHIRWVVRVDVVVETIGGPMLVEDMYFHIVDIDTDRAFLSEKFNEKIGIPTQDELMAQAAKKREKFNSKTLMKRARKIFENIRIPSSLKACFGAKNGVRKVKASVAYQKLHCFDKDENEDEIQLQLNQIQIDRTEAFQEECSEKLKEVMLNVINASIDSVESFDDTDDSDE